MGTRTPSPYFKQLKLSRRRGCQPPAHARRAFVARQAHLNTRTPATSAPPPSPGGSGRSQATLGLRSGFLRRGGAWSPRRRAPSAKSVGSPDAILGSRACAAPRPPAAPAGRIQVGVAGRGAAAGKGLGARTSPQQRILRQFSVPENRGYFRGLPPPPLPGNL